MSLKLNDIKIRNELKPGDIGWVIFLHGSLYSSEYNYGIEHETYVASGLCEFYKNYNPLKERVWICEHNNRIIGFLLLREKDNAAQLRYFLIEKKYRGMGLGKKLIDLFLEFFNEKNYKRAFLWTTNELHTAAHLYKKAGFKLTQEKESTAFGKKLTEQRYDLIL